MISAWSIFCVLEVVGTFLRGEGSEDLADGGADSFNGARGAFAQQRVFRIAVVILTPNAAAMPAGYKLVIALAAELKLPTIYPFTNMVAEGGSAALVCASSPIRSPVRLDPAGRNRGPAFLRRYGRWRCRGCFLGPERRRDQERGRESAEPNHDRHR
jgi:hypothetical protein